jgi:hypothetical protein
MRALGWNWLRSGPLGSFIEPARGSYDVGYLDLAGLAREVMGESHWNSDGIVQACVQPLIRQADW